MLNPTLLVVSVLLISSILPGVSSARILGIFPHIGKSHFFVFEPLMQALAARGHDVHVVSHFPRQTPLPNYTDISIQGSVTQYEPTGAITFDIVAGRSLWFSYLGVKHFGKDTCELVLNCEQLQSLLRSSTKYDVIFSELFNTDCFLGFAHLFKAPHIALSSTSLMPWSNLRFGNPDNPSYIPNSFGSYSSHMTFKERLVNTINYVVMALLEYLPVLTQSISTEHFGASAPSLEQLAMNTSLMLTNSHPSLTLPRPLVPGIIEVGGIHVKQAQKLPEELDRWLNESRHGVVYFSMGSMLRAESIPAEKRAALLQAFAELPERVLWKWEGDSLPGQPDNVRVAKWLPQRDILNHPNVRVFMTHCGMLGVMEAVVSAVPMLAMPLFGDQHSNCKALEQKGVTVVLQYEDLSKESVLKALRALLEDSSYQENADRLSRQFLDRPRSAMDTAIFWTEYVIRHKGAQHLRSAAVELPWYQYLLLDVALVLLGGGVMVAIIVYLAARKLLSIVCGNSKRKELNHQKRK